jgi:hypothetical protein
MSGCLILELTSIYRTLVNIFKKPGNSNNSLIKIEKLLENGFSEDLCKMLVDSCQYPHKPNIQIKISETGDASYFFKGYFDKE